MAGSCEKIRMNHLNSTFNGLAVAPSSPAKTEKGNPTLMIQNRKIPSFPLSPLLSTPTIRTSSDESGSGKVNIFEGFCSLIYI